MRLIGARSTWVWAVLFSCLGTACQDYEYVFQPNTDREGTHLRFAVRQPSKADILFVIDNSRSMRPKQQALKASITQMLDLLAPLDTSYRIGIVSTDAQGDSVDCCGTPIATGDDPEDRVGHAGNCRRCDCVVDGTSTDCNTAADCDPGTLPVCQSGGAPAACPPEACNTVFTSHDTTNFTNRCTRDCDTDDDCPGQQHCDTTATADDGVSAGRCFGDVCRNCAVCEPQVAIRRPHDGVRGRLISAYDPNVFDLNAVDVSGQPLYPPDLIPPGVLTTILADLFPNAGDAKPLDKVPFVLDREQLRAKACEACGIPDACTARVELEVQLRGACCAQAAFESNPDTPDAVCEGTYTLADGSEVQAPLGPSGCGPEMICGRDGACTTPFEECAKPLTRAMVTGFFTSNVNGLGIDGFGWEEGIKSAMLAVGIQPQAPTDDQAIDPGSYLTTVGEFGRPNGANTFLVKDALGIERRESWIRDDATLAIMFVSDEEDCSMPDALLDLRHVLEGTEPAGSLCYQSEAKSQFLGLRRTADILKRLKSSPSQFTIGVIAGAKQTGPAGRVQRSAIPADCALEVVTPDVQPTNQCACVTLPPEEAGSSVDWCAYTTNTSTAFTEPTCDGLASERYIDFGGEFSRHTFDSVCRACPPASSGLACDGFGEALRDFAKLATLPCFEIGEIRPANCNPTAPEFCDADLIEVSHRTGDQAQRGEPMALLPRVDGPDAVVEQTGGWFYDLVENRVCLVGLDRAIDDEYDIFILHRDQIDFAN